MSEDEREVWVVRDEASSPPSRAVSLRKLRRGVKLGKLYLDYEVARVGTDQWMTLGDLLESRRAGPTTVLTESSVVTSAPNRTTSEREAERILRPRPATRPKLRRIGGVAGANGAAGESDGHMSVADEELSFHDFISEDDLEDDGDDDDANETSQLPPVHVDDSAPGELGPLVVPLVVVAQGVPHEPHTPHAALAVSDTPAPPEPSLRDLVVARSSAPAPVVDLLVPEPHVASAPPPSAAATGTSALTPSSPPWPSGSVVVREAGNGRVVVTDIDMPFSSMVRFMVKWAFATIPALLLVGAVVGVVLGVVLAIVTALGIAVSR